MIEKQQAAWVADAGTVVYSGRLIISSSGAWDIAGWLQGSLSAISFKGLDSAAAG